MQLSQTAEIHPKHPFSLLFLVIQYHMVLFERLTQAVLICCMNRSLQIKSSASLLVGHECYEQGPGSQPGYLEQSCSQGLANHSPTRSGTIFSKCWFLKDSYWTGLYDTVLLGSHSSYNFLQLTELLIAQVSCPSALSSLQDQGLQISQGQTEENNLEFLLPFGSVNV